MRKKQPLSMAEISRRCIAYVKKADTLSEARGAYYALPPNMRGSLVGAVAKAKEEGFGMELVTAVLGLCGLMEFPPESIAKRALTTLSDVAKEGEEEAVVALKLALAYASDSPAQLSQDEVDVVSSILSWGCPMGGETEQMLLRFFPNTLSLPTVFMAKMDAQEAALRAEYGDPYKTIRDLCDRVASLQFQLGLRGGPQASGS